MLMLYVYFLCDLDCRDGKMRAMSASGTLAANKNLAGSWTDPTVLLR
jgi:hypothetical protein